MISVVMDTSNQYLAVGIYKEDKCVEKHQSIGTKRQSEEAIPVLSELLSHQNITLRDVDEMIITKGPGSYTGVRVAMTIAKTLAAISKVKVKVVSSLQAYAGKDCAISIIDARSKKVFACVYKEGKALTEEKLFTLEELESLVQEYPSFDVVGELKVIGKENKEIDLVDNMYELAKDMDYVEEVDLLTPTYIKNVEAKKACY